MPAVVCLFSSEDRNATTINICRTTALTEDPKLNQRLNLALSHSQYDRRKQFVTFVVHRVGTRVRLLFSLGRGDRRSPRFSTDERPLKRPQAFITLPPPPSKKERIDEVSHVFAQKC